MEHKDRAPLIHHPQLHQSAHRDPHLVQPGPQNGQPDRYSVTTTTSKPPTYPTPGHDRHFASQLQQQLLTPHPLRIPTPAFSSASPFEERSHSTLLDPILVPSLLSAGAPELRLDSVSASKEDGSWSSDQPLPHATRPKKPRKPKPRIELAPDQPPTTQGKPRARVYVACVQCRTRKIRCDGAKPVCHNCSRRTNGNNECNYDSVPKRRGPDKTPGARQRIPRNEGDPPVLPPRRRRRRPETASSGSGTHQDSPERSKTPASNSPGRFTPPEPSPDVETPHRPDNPRQAQQPYPSSCSCHGMYQCPGLLELDTLSKPTASFSYAESLDLVDAHVLPARVESGYITEIDENGNECRQESDIGSQPSINFTRKIWWDSLLALYLSPERAQYQPLTSSQRETAAQAITTDIRFMFRASNYWFSFFHVPTFFATYFDPVRRERLQPSLILSMLAMATFWQSSEIGFGEEGRRRALRFRDAAQAALEASFNAGWIDETLAQAAWLLALFEVCAHPGHTSSRTISSMVMLDSIIRGLSLTIMDADDPNASIFSPGAVPAVPDRQHPVWFPDPPAGGQTQGFSGVEHTGCSCSSITLLEHWPSASEHAPLWSTTPAWNGQWTEAEIRKESCRRLCWSSMILAAGHISYSTAVSSPVLDLFIADPSNYALLFSGESVARSPALHSPHSSKNTIWALYDRAFLLWHYCIKMRKNANISDSMKADFAMKAWVEADALEEALNQHTCSIERAFIFQGREYIFNTRMLISHEFRRYIPLVSACVLRQLDVKLLSEWFRSDVTGLFHRRKAEEWLSHQATVAQRFMQGLHTVTGNLHNLLARRPFFVFWFMGQISRSLNLWHCDHTLTIALDVCKALLPPIDYLTALWPCPEQRRRYTILRHRLEEACFQAHVPSPPPMDLSISLPSLV